MWHKTKQKLLLKMDGFQIQCDAETWKACVGENAGYMFADRLPGPSCGKNSMSLTSSVSVTTRTKDGSLEQRPASNDPQNTYF